MRLHAMDGIVLTEFPDDRRTVFQTMVLSKILQTGARNRSSEGIPQMLRAVY